MSETTANVNTTFIIPTKGRKTLSRALCSIPDGYNVRVGVGQDTGNEGPGAVRQRLIEQAETEWVSFLDDDDTVTSDYIERLAEEIAAHPTADCVIFRQYHLDGTIFPIEPVIKFGNVGVSFSVRRAVALELPFRSEEYEDLAFLKRLEAANKVIIFSPYLTYKVRH